MIKKIKQCRVCGHNFFHKPLLIYKNMPKGAQFFPDKNSVKNEKGVDMEIFQCSGCGLIQLNSKPVSYYKDVIRASAVSEEMKSFRKKQFKDFVKKYSLKQKKILEIGCGRGENLSIMQQCNVKAFGIEHLDESVNYCLENKLSVTGEFIGESNQKLQNAPFDAFYILNFLEHLPSPNTILTGIYNNLNDEGIGLVEVPNFDMMLRNNLFSEFIPDHLFYFTKETLGTILSLNGFDIIEYTETRYDYVITAIVKKRKKMDLTHFYSYQNRLKDNLDLYLKQFNNKKVAIWGAGHQALAVIAMTGIADKICYIVDSATFKQDKYSPATHIHIVAPDTLKTNPVDAIIIMAGSYSDEIVSIIKQKYNKNIMIAILRDFELEII